LKYPSDLNKPLDVFNHSGLYADRLWGFHVYFFYLFLKFRPAGPACFEAGKFGAGGWNSHENNHQGLCTSKMDSCSFYDIYFKSVLE